MKKTTRKTKKVEIKKVSKDNFDTDPDFFRFDDEYTPVEKYKATEIEQDNTQEQEVVTTTTKTTYKIENNCDDILIKEEKKDYSGLLYKLNRIAKILLKITIVVSLLILFDLFLITRFHFGPLFAVRVNTYDDGGTKEYYGLGYKVIKYNILNGREDMVVGNYSLKYTAKAKKIDLSSLNKNDLSEENNGDYVRITGKVKSIDKKNKRVVLVNGKNKVYCDMKDNSNTYSKISEGKNISIEGNMYIEKLSNTIELYLEKGVVK